MLKTPQGYNQPSPDWKIIKHYKTIDSVSSSNLQGERKNKKAREAESDWEQGHTQEKKTEWDTEIQRLDTANIM